MDDTIDFGKEPLPIPVELEELFENIIKEIKSNIDDYIIKGDVMMTDAAIKFIITRIIENAKDAIEESKLNENDDFYKGRKLAYYEILDTIKNELEVRDQDLKEFGLDIDLESIF